MKYKITLSGRTYEVEVTKGASVDTDVPLVVIG